MVWLLKKRLDKLRAFFIRYAFFLLRDGDCSRLSGGGGSGLIEKIRGRRRFAAAVGLFVIRRGGGGVAGRRSARIVFRRSHFLEYILKSERGEGRPEKEGCCLLGEGV